jgi:O-antigen ligase
MNLKFKPSSINSSIKILLFVASLFGYGLVGVFVDDGSDSRGLTVPYRLFIFLLTLFVVFNTLTLKKSELTLSSVENSIQPAKKKSIPILYIILFLFITIYSFRLIYDVIYNNYLTKNIEQYPLIWFGICLLPGFSFLYLELKKSKIYLYLSWIFLQIASFLSFFLLKPGNNINTQTRLSGEALNPISLGQQSATLMLLSIYIICNYDQIISLIERILLLFSGLAGLVLLLLSGSRSPVICSSICLVLLFLNIKVRGYKTNKLLIVIIATITVISFVIFYAIISGNSLFLSRILDTLNGNDFDSRKFVQRPELYDLAMQLITDNPILGYGLELPKFGYPHNLILESFLTTGIFGGFLFVIIYSYTFVKALSMIFDKNNSWSWMAIIYVQYAVVIMFSGSLYGSSTFWYLTFAIIGFKKYKIISD